jgi:hypothetical protein
MQDNIFLLADHILRLDSVLQFSHAASNPGNRISHSRVYI